MKSPTKHRLQRQPSQTLNVLTVDVEEWFCVSGFENIIRKEDWPRMESRIEGAMHEILALLDHHNVKATFFVLGWLAERHPELIRTVAARGHELASHGYEHRLVYDTTPLEFRADLSKSIQIVEEIVGQRCLGYRAPSFSLRMDMTWAWDVIIDLGFRYDSSVFPVSHDRYGDPLAPRFPFTFSRGRSKIVVFPLSTVTAFSRNIPVAGGGYLRLYPLSITRWAIRRINSEGHPAVVYIHPWELDAGHPRPRVSKLTLWRHRVGIGGVFNKLHSLLSEFRFGTMTQVLETARNPVPERFAEDARS